MLHYICISSTNISTEYFKHAEHSPVFSSKCRLFHNATLFASCIISILQNLNVKLRCQKVKQCNETQKCISLKAVQLLNRQWTYYIFLTFVCPNLYIFNQIASYLYIICTPETVLLIHELLTLYMK